VEHPVTEWVTGLDLVALQIKVAEGEKLPFTDTVQPRGHAIEVRIYAEDPARNFMPSPGKIQYLRVPGGPNVRDDSGVFAGYTVPNFYDPMISKLSVWAPTRAEAIARAQRALSEYVVKGITTNTRGAGTAAAPGSVCGVLMRFAGPAADRARLAAARGVRPCVPPCARHAPAAARA
jgi:acetyl-CoA carboxylase biotin carboxylase subunit